MESVDLGGVEIVVGGYEIWGLFRGGPGGRKMIVGRDGDRETIASTWMKNKIVWQKDKKREGVERLGKGSTSYSIVQCRTFLEPCGSRPISKVSLRVLWVYHLYKVPCSSLPETFQPDDFVFDNHRVVQEVVLLTKERDMSWCHVWAQRS